MKSLVKNSGIKITDQDEILQEFYKTLYAKRVCIEADLFDLLNKFQAPKLEDADNILLSLCPLIFSFDVLKYWLSL